MNTTEQYQAIYTKYKYLTLNIIKTYKFPLQEDVLADVWEKIYKKLQQNQIDVSHRGFGSYVITITHNHCKDIYRSDQKKRKAFSTLSIPDVDTQETGIDEAVTIVFDKIKQKVNPFTFEVMCMRYIDGKSFDEIAKQTGKTLTTLRVLVHRTIKSLNKDELIRNIF